ncbi:E3 ubiquitin-protein ligase ARIH2-like [Arapaima gigas]
MMNFRVINDEEVYERLSVRISTTETMSSEEIQAQCPRCQQPCPRPEYGHRTVCATCSKTRRKVFLFCWACRREWHELAEETSCSLPGCELRAALLSTKTITHHNTSVDGCPFFRACPSCKTLLTHTGQGCKNIKCPVCNTWLCFRCLKTGICHGVCRTVDNKASLRALNV